ncbi:sigma-70 family RNA polymerase sigma factor [Streptomyces sp. NPDC096132]|uniref:sigma-70 family RNA polymerase sigma factor n=1 Tax=Streptomyces sp. NPDC096132 TaxID=3366075 RepID=UPI0037F7ECA8
MAGDESTGSAPGTLTEEQAGRMLADINEVIRAGEEMRALRAEMIQVFAGLGWTQDAIARLAGMSQPAVSKQMTKHRDDPPAPMELTLDQPDIPWLEGRLWGLAEEISESLDHSARCTRYVDAVARGRKRFTPENVDALRRLVEEDLRARRAELPTAHRAAYDGISRGLDLSVKAPPTTGSASVRRTLARRLQRDGLRGDGLRGDRLRGD